MEKETLIAVHDFCAHYNIELDFVGSLQDYGLVEITTIENTWFISQKEVINLEKIIRLYFELEVNLEGIETINHLLHRVNEMQSRINKLENRLRFYEGN